MSDEEIMRALIGQVSKAAGTASEQEVTTRISRPMWNAFCRATNMDENSAPTEWLGPQKTCRVYGSETIVFDSDELISWSYKATGKEVEP